VLKQQGACELQAVNNTSFMLVASAVQRSKHQTSHKLFWRELPQHHLRWWQPAGDTGAKQYGAKGGDAVDADFLKFFETLIYIT
jgi:hypothetical protein